MIRQAGSGSVVFHQDEPGDEMFFIVSGRVSLNQGTARKVGVLGPGEFFGELALLGNSPRTATAVAIEDTTLLAVRRETFGLIVQDDLAVVYRMLDELGRRLSATTLQMQELSQQAQRARLGAHVLEACLVNREGMLVVDPVSAASATDVAPEEIETAIRVFAARGIGKLDAGRWRLDPQVDAARLARALAAER